MIQNPGYKVIMLFKRAPGLSGEAFTDRWLAHERTTPTSFARLTGSVFDAPLVTQSPITSATDSSFDSGLEMWWETKNSMAAWLESSEFRRGWFPARRELLSEHPTCLGGTPVLVKRRTKLTDPNEVKVIALPVALRRLRFSEFVDRWTHDHAKLALAGPHSSSHLSGLEYTPTPPGGGTTAFKRGRFDGFAAITFSSAQALASEFSSSYYRDVLAPDEERFSKTGDSEAFLTREFRLAGMPPGHIPQ